MTKEPELDEHKPAEKPISLHPLKFEEAVKGLFDVRPGSESKNDG